MILWKKTVQKSFYFSFKLWNARAWRACVKASWDLAFMIKVFCQWCFWCDAIDLAKAFDYSGTQSASENKKRWTHKALFSSHHSHTSSTAYSEQDPELNILVLVNRQKPMIFICTAVASKWKQIYTIGTRREFITPTARCMCCHAVNVSFCLLFFSSLASPLKVDGKLYLE